MPSLNPWKKKRTSITASAGDLGAGQSPASPKVIAKRQERWQKKVLELISSVPEASGASALIQNTLNQVELTIEAPGVSDEDREQIQELLEGFDLGRSGMLLWQVGENYVVFEVEEDGLKWEVNSPVEFEVAEGKKPKHMNSHGKMEELSSNARYFRIWKPDPARKYNAWSPHKSLIDLLESMYLHQLADTAVATSRLAGAGILFWPTDLPDLPLKDGRPEEGSRQHLAEELHKAMMQSISDRNSSDAVVPLIVFGDPSLGDNFKPEHILLERPDDAKAFSERMEKYSNRYAKGVELPIESVDGMGPANHWTAWVVKEDKWRFYINPLVMVITEGLTKNFIKPTLRGMNYPEEVVKNAKVIADGSKLIEKPDKSANAIRLAQIGEIISDEALRRETGFEEDDAWKEGRDKAGDTQISRSPSELPANMRDDSNPLDT